MKNYLLFLLIAFSGIIKAQSQKITFEYDAAGNQIKRELCLDCASKNLEKEEIKEIAALKEEDLQKFDSGDTFSYYPNPVREELYLQWERTNDVKIKTIKVYNFNGQELRSYSPMNSNAQTIPFQAYPAGVYLVVLEYIQGDQKSIKISKSN